MPRDPKFVALANHLKGVCQVDIDSGWGISGRDVRAFPEDPGAQTYVRSGLQRGIFEEAGQAEWDEVHEVDVEDSETPVVRFVHASEALPENKLREQVSKKRAAIEARAAARDAADAGEDLGEDEEPDGYQAMSNSELQAELANRGLSTGGNKGQMARRLEQHDKTQAANEAGGDDDDDEEDEEES